jgi:hypothetical protein
VFSRNAVFSKEASVMKGTTIVAFAAFGIFAWFPTAVPGQPASSTDRDALARELSGAWLPLESGMTVSRSEGTPISAKYEIDDGAFQLSVYTSKNGPSSSETFMEVIVDYSAGIVIKAVPITDDGDLAAARAQKEAMDRAKRSLAEVTAAVVQANAGYRAVSSTPRLDNGQPVAEVTLVRGSDWKVVNERLD